MLWVLANFETFDLLYTGRGLGIDDVVDLVVTMAERTLLRDPHPSNSHSDGYGSVSA